MQTSRASVYEALKGRVPHDGIRVGACAAISATGTGWPDISSVSYLAQNTQLPRSLVGERGSRYVLLENCVKGGVYNVHTFRFGSGRISAGLARIAYVFLRSQ
jgi:hypothetical protein